ncbi:hypothetical protein BJY24_002052 [Nocardia transvalensis]|uniref:Uncharacterized protein n=1 Tax=Nocardia transvalensis TaxID=37333 RepID=A0A7W9UHZ7_9NOCA|nr:hypothetical protein [Nocardia transvalensis]MBB5913185.1 hypothetical protein [Nocardia transvalensis]
MSAGSWAVLFAVVLTFCAVVGMLVRTELDDRSDDDGEPCAGEFVAWTHAAPPRPFTVAGAHKVMQQHKDCRREECPRKAAAWRTLTDARRIRPDSGRSY